MRMWSVRRDPSTAVCLPVLLYYASHTLCPTYSLQGPARLGLVHGTLEGGLLLLDRGEDALLDLADLRLDLRGDALLQLSDDGRGESLHRGDRLDGEGGGGEDGGGGGERAELDDARARAHLRVLALLHRRGVVGLVVADPTEDVVERADRLLRGIADVVLAAALAAALVVAQRNLGRWQIAQRRLVGVHELRVGIDGVRLDELGKVVGERG
mmetsp:Transcript_2392/g.5872  ORF Transcript_2392/g.5872 Transcript_2392/m.5872 type:complete len:212 (-) Transcript_2392:721-1356(-)